MLHFLLLGAMLFAAYPACSTARLANPGKIIVSQARIQHLGAGFAGTWLRAPTPRNSMTDTRLSFERKYITVKRWRWDWIATTRSSDDGFSRKLEFRFHRTSTACTSPTDEKLRTFLQNHPDQFRSPRRLSFHQALSELGAPPWQLRRRREAATWAVKEFRQLRCVEIGRPISARSSLYQCRRHRRGETIRRELCDRAKRSAARGMARTRRIQLRRSSGIR